MKYLNALLQGQEIPRPSRNGDPPKPQKPILEVSEGVSGSSPGETSPRSDYIEREERLGLQEFPLWPCPHCGTQAEIEGVGPSRDGTYQLTFWHCLPCQIWAVTPSDLREPPTGWVPKRMQ